MSRSEERPTYGAGGFRHDGCACDCRTTDGFLAYQRLKGRAERPEVREKTGQYRGKLPGRERACAVSPSVRGTMSNCRYSRAFAGPAGNVVVQWL